MHWVVVNDSIHIITPVLKITIYLNRLISVSFVDNLSNPSRWEQMFQCYMMWDLTNQDLISMR